MGLSKELQMGKAGEHLVCCDLILQGYNAFLTDAGLPFDVLVEVDCKLKRIQVRTTNEIRTCGKSKSIYRFGTRRGRGAITRVTAAEVDYYAFVALDTKKVAYIPIKKMISRSGGVKQTMDFKSHNIKYSGRIYTNGTVRTPEWGKYFEDYGKLE